MCFGMRTELTKVLTVLGSCHSCYQTQKPFVNVRPAARGRGARVECSRTLAPCVRERLAELAERDAYPGRNRCGARGGMCECRVKCLRCVRGGARRCAAVRARVFAAGGAWRARGLALTETTPEPCAERFCEVMRKLNKGSVIVRKFAVCSLWRGVAKVR